MPAPRRPQPPVWFLKGNCTEADPQLFFGPDGGEPDAVRAHREATAKAYCADCPIREACLVWSVEEGERYGIWGGMNEEERTDMRRAARARREAARRRGSRVA